MPGEQIPWPEADSVGGHWGNLPGKAFDGWYVFGVPPEPFVTRDPADHYWPRAKYGPPATIWVFTLGDLLDRVVGIPASKIWSVVRKLLKKLARIPGFTVPAFWPIPNSYDPEGAHMHVAQVVVHGKLGNIEEVAHTFHLVAAPDANAPQTIASMAALAATVRDKWHDFFTGAANSNGDSLASVCPTELVYDFASARFVDQPAPAPGATGPVRATELIATQYASFGVNDHGVNAGGKIPLPYEVAMCVGLNSNFRGPRFRGRVYLGPFCGGIMTSLGLFDAALSKAIANKLGVAFLDPINQTSPFDFHVLSRKYGTSVPIQGTRSGSVPDSQRRRRKSQPEAYQQAWGTAIGGS